MDKQSWNLKLLVKFIICYIPSLNHNNKFIDLIYFLNSRVWSDVLVEMTEGITFGGIDISEKCILSHSASKNVRFLYVVVCAMSDVK